MVTVAQGAATKLVGTVLMMATTWLSQCPSRPRPRLKPRLTRSQWPSQTRCRRRHRCHHRCHHRCRIQHGRCRKHTRCPSHHGRPSHRHCPSHRLCLSLSRRLNHRPSQVLQPTHVVMTVVVERAAVEAMAAGALVAAAVMAAVARAAAVRAVAARVVAARAEAARVEAVRMAVASLAVVMAVVVREVAVKAGVGKAAAATEAVASVAVMEVSMEAVTAGVEADSMRSIQRTSADRCTCATKNWDCLRTTARMVEVAATAARQAVQAGVVRGAVLRRSGGACGAEPQEKAGLLKYSHVHRRRATIGRAHDAHPPRASPRSSHSRSLPDSSQGEGSLVAPSQFPWRTDSGSCTLMDSEPCTRSASRRSNCGGGENRVAAAEGWEVAAMGAATVAAATVVLS
jgi:hypothetical protein